jgi:hypothetical protein
MKEVNGNFEQAEALLRIVYSLLFDAVLYDKLFHLFRVCRAYIGE